MAQQTLFLAPPIPFGVIGALVMILFAFSDTNFQLHFATMVKIHYQWYQSQAFALGIGP